MFRAKPAVVMIGIRADATATVRCGAGAPVSVADGCEEALASLPAEARSREIRTLAAEPANRSAVDIQRALYVSLSNGKTYPAQVKSYSPPAYIEVGRTTDATGTARREFGKDIAILKIDAHDLPVVRLARHSTNLHLGQDLFVIGCPGVVASHELLSAASRFEPSVTVGRVSGFVHQRDQRHRIRIERSVAGPSKPAEGFRVTIMPAVPPPAARTS